MNRNVGVHPPRATARGSNFVPTRPPWFDAEWFRPSRRHLGAEHCLAGPLARDHEQPAPENRFNIVGTAQAGLFADAAINMAILSLLSEQNQHASDLIHDGRPLFCSMEGVTVVLAIEDESGKIDLNSAPPRF